MKKWRRLAAAVLCLCLLFLLLPVSSSADGPGFIAVNDQLPSELVGTLYTYGGILYVPCTVFTSYGLGVYYSYFSQSSTAYLYTLDKQIFFSLSDGETFDGDGYYYSTSAIMRGGTIYLPLTFTCSFFGLSYSFIAGSGYGDVLRVKNGSQVLTDTEFIKAARNVMQSYYDAWAAAQEPEATPAPSHTPAPTVTPEPAEPDRERPDVSISFIGLPSGETLDILDAYGVSACFFLTGEEVRSDPDTVRRIAGEGHTLGVFCREDPEAEYRETAGLIFEAARVQTLLVTADGEHGADCALWAEEQGLVFCPRGLDAVGGEGKTVSAYHVTYTLEAAQSDTDLFLSATGEDVLSTVLDYLTRNRYGIRLLRETD